MRLQAFVYIPVFILFFLLSLLQCSSSDSRNIVTPRTPINISRLTSAWQDVVDEAKFAPSRRTSLILSLSTFASSPPLYPVTINFSASEHINVLTPRHIITSTSFTKTFVIGLFLDSEFSLTDEGEIFFTITSEDDFYQNNLATNILADTIIFEAIPSSLFDLQGDWQDIIDEQLFIYSESTTFSLDLSALSTTLSSLPLADITVLFSSTNDLTISPSSVVVDKDSLSDSFSIRVDIQDNISIIELQTIQFEINTFDLSYDGLIDKLSFQVEPKFEPSVLSINWQNIVDQESFVPDEITQFSIDFESLLFASPDSPNADITVSFTTESNVDITPLSFVIGYQTLFDSEQTLDISISDSTAINTIEVIQIHLSSSDLTYHNLETSFQLNIIPKVTPIIFSDYWTSSLLEVDFIRGEQIEPILDLPNETRLDRFVALTITFSATDFDVGLQSTTLTFSNGTPMHTLSLNLYDTLSRFAQSDIYPINFHINSIEDAKYRDITGFFNVSLVEALSITDENTIELNSILPFSVSDEDSDLTFYINRIQSPTSNIVIYLNVSDETLITVTPISFTFTTSSSATQTITVTPVSTTLTNYFVQTNLKFQVVSEDRLYYNKQIREQEFLLTQPQNFVAGTDTFEFFAVLDELASSEVGQPVVLLVIPAISGVNLYSVFKGNVFNVPETTASYLFGSETSFVYRDTIKDNNISDVLYYRTVLSTGEESYARTETSPGITLSCLVDNFNQNIGDSPTNATSISTLCELNEVSLNLDKHFQLTENIEAIYTRRWNDQQGFFPIGACASETIDCTTTNYFTGSLDGNAYSIQNLYINSLDISLVGLFGGVLASSANTYVKDLTLSNLQLSSEVSKNVTADIDNTEVGTKGSYIGGIAGVLISSGGVYSIIQNVKIDAKSSLHAVSSSTNVYMGGLVGHIFSSHIEHSVVLATFSSIRQSNSMGHYFFGGLVGKLDNQSSILTSATVIKSAHITSQSSSESYLGGLVGVVQGESSVSSSMSLSELTSYSTNANRVLLGGAVALLDNSSMSDIITVSKLSSEDVYQLESSESVPSNSRLISGGIIAEMQDSLLNRSLAISPILIQVSQISSEILLRGGLVAHILDDNISEAVMNSYVDNLVFIERENDMITFSSTKLIGGDETIDESSCVHDWFIADLQENGFTDNISACSDDALYGFSSDSWDYTNSSYIPVIKDLASLLDPLQNMDSHELRLWHFIYSLSFFSGGLVDNDNIRTPGYQHLDNVSNIIFLTPSTTETLQEGFYPVNLEREFSQRTTIAITIRDWAPFTETTETIFGDEVSFSFKLAYSKDGIESDELIFGNSRRISILSGFNGITIRNIDSLFSNEAFYLIVTAENTSKDLQVKRTFLFIR